MNSRAYVVSVVVLIASFLHVQAGEPISPPSPDLLRFMRNADQIFIFPNPNSRRPRRDDKHMRLLPANARRDLLRLIGHKRGWYYGWDNRIDPGGPPPKDINLLFRRGRDELMLFFYPGQVIDARFNGRRQPSRWVIDIKSRESMERWEARYARPELAAR